MSFSNLQRASLCTLQYAAKALLHQQVMKSIPDITSKVFPLCSRSVADTRDFISLKHTRQFTYEKNRPETG
jgi:hypothetical protein